MTQCAIPFLNVRKIDSVKQKRERLILKFIEIRSIDEFPHLPYYI